MAKPQRPAVFKWRHFAPPGLGPYQPRRPYPDFRDNITVNSNTNSNYNSLQTKLTKRFSHGLTFLASYTWAHNLSDNEGDEGFGGGVGNLAAQDDNNPRADYGNTSLDARQRFVFSSVWALPVGKGQHFMNCGGVLNAILGGWRVSDIIILQSGFPISVLSNQDFSNIGTLNFRPDRLCNGVARKTIDAWFNAACFTTAALEQALAAGDPRFGNDGRNILAGPGLDNYDLGLLKDFLLSERFKLEFRGEMYKRLQSGPLRTSEYLYWELQRRTDLKRWTASGSSVWFEGRVRMRWLSPRGPVTLASSFWPPLDW